MVQSHQGASGCQVPPCVRRGMQRHILLPIMFSYTGMTNSPIASSHVALYYRCTISRHACSKHDLGELRCIVDRALVLALTAASLGMVRALQSLVSHRRVPPVENLPQQEVRLPLPPTMMMMMMTTCLTPMMMRTWTSSGNSRPLKSSHPSSACFQ